MANFTPEQVLGLQDPEKIQQIIENPDFAEYLSTLQLEIYRDDTLADVRNTLMREAIKSGNVDCDEISGWTDKQRKTYRRNTYPLAFDDRQVIDLRVRALAKVRCAVKKAHPMNDKDQERRSDLRKILRTTKDGDLTYSYTESNEHDIKSFAGKDSIDAMYIWNPHFSPELQLKAAKEKYDIGGPHDQDRIIVDILAEQGKLTIPAWETLLRRDDLGTHKAVWNTKDVRPEILQLINRNEKLALLYSARTDSEAQKQILGRASEFGRIDIKRWIDKRNAEKPGKDVVYYND